MKSHITKGFRKYLAALPDTVQIQATKSYALWRKDNYHSSLQFKQVSKKQVIYSVRIGISYRALGFVEDDQIYRFWIGPHAEYDNLIERL